MATQSPGFLSSSPAAANGIFCIIAACIKKDLELYKNVTNESCLIGSASTTIQRPVCATQFVQCD